MKYQYIFLLFLLLGCHSEPSVDGINTHAYLAINTPSSFTVKINIENNTSKSLELNNQVKVSACDDCFSEMEIFPKIDKDYFETISNNNNIYKTIKPYEVATLAFTIKTKRKIDYKNIVININNLKYNNSSNTFDKMLIPVTITQSNTGDLCFK